MTLLEDLRRVTRPGGLSEVSLEHTGRLVALCARAADEIEAQQTWLPIDTAPKDGRIIEVTESDVVAANPAEIYPGKQDLAYYHPIVGTWLNGIAGQDFCEGISLGKGTHLRYAPQFWRPARKPPPAPGWWPE